MAPESGEKLDEILSELRQLRAVVDGLLTDFSPVLALFSQGKRPGYTELAGAARAMKRRARERAEANGDGW